MSFLKENKDILLGMALTLGFSIILGGLIISNSSKISDSQSTKENQEQVAEGLSEKPYEVSEDNAKISEDNLKKLKATFAKLKPSMEVFDYSTNKLNTVDFKNYMTSTVGSFTSAVAKKTITISKEAERLSFGPFIDKPSIDSKEVELLNIRLQIVKMLIDCMPDSLSSLDLITWPVIDLIPSPTGMLSYYPVEVAVSGSGEAIELFTNNVVSNKSLFTILRASEIKNISSLSKKVATKTPKVNDKVVKKAPEYREDRSVVVPGVTSTKLYIDVVQFKEIKTPDQQEEE